MAPFVHYKRSATPTTPQQNMSQVMVAFLAKLGALVFFITEDGVQAEPVLNTMTLAHTPYEAAQQQSVWLSLFFKREHMKFVQCASNCPAQDVLFEKPHRTSEKGCAQQN
eukprot:2486229-Amphidinium_carterae.1